MNLARPHDRDCRLRWEAAQPELGEQPKGVLAAPMLRARAVNEANHVDAGDHDLALDHFHDAGTGAVSGASPELAGGRSAVLEGGPTAPGHPRHGGTGLAVHEQNAASSKLPGCWRTSGSTVCVTAIMSSSMRPGSLSTVVTRADTNTTP